MGKDTELFKAAQSGNTGALEKAFANHLKRISGQSSHHGSTRSKHHPNMQDQDGSTLLHHAILNSHRETVNLLLRCGASTSIVDNSGSAPLHLAAWKGDLEVVRMLVTQGPSYANVNQQNDSEDTSLHLASQYGYAQVVEFLLQRHADPLLRNCREETPLDLAAQYGHLSCVHFLISFSPETLRHTPRGLSPLHLAARNGHTIVALSLINAGISVNTTCDSGSALHEAAVCGKVDMVELLLDKGVDCDLKDKQGRTVLDTLQLYTANQATEIRRRIQLHLDDQRRLRSRSLRNPVSRVFAVAKTTSQPLMEGSSALAFSTGDQILVQRHTGGGVYYGTVREKSGSFLAEDVFFYKEVEGELVATPEAELNMLPDHTPSRLGVCEATPTPDSPTPPTPATEDTGPIEQLLPIQPRPHSKSAGDPTLSHIVITSNQPRPNSMPDCDQLRIHNGWSHPHSDLPHPHDDLPHSHGDLPHPSVDQSHPQTSDHLHGAKSGGSTSQLVAEVLLAHSPSPRTLGAAATPSSKSSAGSTPSPRISGGEGTSSSNGARAGEESALVRKMTKKEKKFVLSRDKGQYSELNPISPHEARQEFGDSLHLKQVEPPVDGVVEDPVAVSSSSSSAVPQPNPGDLRGSYYVLEVGNFGDLSPTSEVTSGGSRLSEASDSSCGRVETQPVAGESGYYLLNTEAPGGGMEDEVYSSVAGTRKAKYENISAAKTALEAGVVAQPVPVRGDGVGRPGQILSASSEKNRISSYENISLTAGTMSPPELPAVLTPPTNLIPGRLSDGSRLSGRPSSSYENIEGYVVHSSVNSSHAPSATPTSTVGNIRRSAQQRRDAYEILPLKTRKNNSTTLGATAKSNAQEHTLPCGGNSTTAGNQAMGEVEAVTANSGGGARLEEVTTWGSQGDIIEAGSSAVLQGSSTGSSAVMQGSSTGSSAVMQGSSTGSSAVMQGSSTGSSAVMQGSSTGSSAVMQGSSTGSSAVMQGSSTGSSAVMQGSSTGSSAVMQGSSTGSSAVMQGSSTGSSAVMQGSSTGSSAVMQGSSTGSSAVMQGSSTGSSAVLQGSSTGSSAVLQGSSTGSSAVMQGSSTGPNRETGLEYSIVHVTGTSPFAGLVMTDSQKRDQDQDQDKSETDTGLDTGNPELWDSVQAEQEWSQIDSLMQDVAGICGGTPPTSLQASTSATHPSEIYTWLSMVGLAGCSSNLLVHGFDNLRFLGGGILLMDDLDDMGLTSPDDQYNLMAAVSLLAPPPPVGHASTVAEWLGLLDLDMLSYKFEQYTLSRIARLWDVQLTSVMGVELLGHRKRLLYGVQELCEAHPDWQNSDDLKPLTKQSPAHPASPLFVTSPVKRAFLKDYRALRSSAAASTEGDVAQLKVRGPIEAQSGGTSECGRVLRLPSRVWRHDNNSLIKSSITYDVHYLGSVLVKKMHGSQSAEEACLKLRMSTLNMKKIPEISLSISWKGVKFLDSKSKQLVSFHRIRDVSFCTSDIEDKTVFAYITKDRNSAKNYSHVFIAESQEVADDIRLTLAQAFEICYQKVMRVRMMSPESK